MRRLRPFVLSVALCGLALLSASRIAADDSAAPPLDELLDRLGRLATLYRDSALEFGCDEQVSWDVAGDGVGSQRFGYVYTWDDQLGFDDYRTRPGRPAQRLKQAWPGAPAFVRNALLWVFVFRPERRTLHEFEFLGPDEVHGRAAWKIRFTPVAPYHRQRNWWYGTAWVDRETSQILRIETWDVEDMRQRTALERALAGGGIDPTPYLAQTIVTDFTVARHGMRFPGEVRILRERIRVVGPSRRRRAKRRVEFEVTQTYTNYRFFSVRAESEIQEILREAGR